MALPPQPKTPNSWKTLVIVLLVVVIIMGVIVGILSTNQGKLANNQVKVSGSIQEHDPNTIYFASISKTVATSSIITNGHYSVVLVGNQSYAVIVAFRDDNGTPQEDNYALYVPSGVTTFTANF
jgi:hypothetical protein